MRRVVLQHISILHDRNTSVYAFRFHGWHILGELIEDGFYLICQLASVAHDKTRDLAINWFQLLQHRKDEDSSLSHPTLGLADDIGS